MSSRHRPLLLFISSLFTLSLTSGNFTALAQCLPDQNSSLLLLKQGFSSPSFILPSWKRGTDCCTWDGVTCDSASGRVTDLDLSNLFISGEIDHSLFNLTALRTFNLAYNLFDSIPIPAPGFERLGNLTNLNLSNAGFIGQVPIGISRLKKLVSLDLSTFYLDTGPSFSLKLENPSFQTLIRNLTNLKKLYLDGVDISASGNEWCRSLSEAVPGLQVLSLSGCSLSGPIDSSLSRLGSLTEIRLYHNNLSSVVPEFFGNFSTLSVLWLSDCGLQGSLPERIFQLSSLTVLDVSNNPMLTGYLPEFPNYSALENLVLSDSNLTGNLPESIGNLRSLTKLQLMNCSFSGTIPSTLGKLTHLVHLDLSYNNFSGEIPSGALPASISELILSHNSLTGSIPSYDNATLHNLIKLDLFSNLLSGPIPTSLFTLPVLQNLQIGQNQLSGQLEEFSNASSSLETVDLSNNMLQGLIPSSVFKLSGLKILSLASNNFSGTVRFDSFGSLKNLSNLDLSNNRLSILDGDVNSSSSFPKIGTLKLVSCNLTQLPSFLRNQDKLSIVDLSNNRISGTIPKWIWSIGNKNLNYLNLSYNLFTDVERPLPDLSMSPSIILDLHSNMLRGPIPLPPPFTIVLDYSNNYFTSSIPSNITLYLNSTVFFSLSNNSLTGIIPPSICSAGYLQVLDLSVNNLSGSIPSCLAEVGNTLCVLNLRENQFKGIMPQNFSDECTLQTINLNGNHLEGGVPRSLANCNVLEVLDLGNNGMVDSFPFWLGNLSELRVLVLRSNRFYGPIGPPSGSNCTFSMLHIIDLSSNNFVGSLPSEWFSNLKAMRADPEPGRPNVAFTFLDLSRLYYQDSVTITIKGQELTLVKILTIFTSIDLSNNGFEGSIPELIGKLKSLYMLNMSGNALTGRIPSQLGNLMQLESLDLSRNKLSGEIPQELSSLTFLSFLNLSFNYLVGRIPQGSQFLTFSDNSFEGNEGLCVKPLSKLCAGASEEPPDSKLAASKSGSEPNWLLICVEVGFITGLALVVGPLVVWGKWRRWYYRHIDRFHMAMFPSTMKAK